MVGRNSVLSNPWISVAYLVSKQKRWLIIPKFRDLEFHRTKAKIPPEVTKVTRNSLWDKTQRYFKILLIRQSSA